MNFGLYVRYLLPGLLGHPLTPLHVVGSAAIGGPYDIDHYICLLDPTVTDKPVL